MKITMNTNEVSVCDGCSNWRICKFSEDVKRAEAEYKQLEKMQIGLNVQKRRQDVNISSMLQIGEAPKFVLVKNTCGMEKRM